MPPAQALTAAVKAAQAAVSGGLACRLTCVAVGWCGLAAGWRLRLLPSGPLLGTTCSLAAGSTQGPRGTHGRSHQELSCYFH